MELDKMTYGEIKELMNIFSDNSNKTDEKDIASSFKDRYCIFRTYSAGVFFGILKERDKNAQEAIIENCRRIWNWTGAFTLSVVATEGVESARLSVEEPVKLASGVIEIIPASEKCINQLKNMESHNE